MADAMEKAVRDGRLPLGAQLPAERLLAGELGLARDTMTASYQILRAEQLIVTRAGSETTLGGQPWVWRASDSSARGGP
ncbi:GntR family transcriptional regulator [Streptomyces sp. NPDC057363]|uniref:GntR family transcriptional regulator n=1 Tax=unclassified Streptomyces TaxID=2593676 RepID=UPI00363F41C7